MTQSTNDFDAIDGSQDSQLSVCLVATGEIAKAKILSITDLDPSITIKLIEHGEATEDTDADILILECRIMECLQDLELINQFRMHRPMLPVLVVSSNTDEDFVLMSYSKGANEFIDLELSIEVLAQKIHAFHMFCDTSRLVELKNNEVINTMQDLRGTKLDLEDEKAGRLVAEQRIHHLKEVQEIMDSLNEGFFYVNPETVIGQTISKKCHEIFGSNLAGMNLSQALQLKDNKGPFIEYCAMQVFEDILPLKASLSMLPDQVTTLDGKILSLKYNVSRDANDKVNKIIFISQDVTKQVELERQNTKRKNNDRCLINILKSRDQFMLFLEDFRNEMNLLRHESDLPQANRILHTIKGTAGVFGLDELAHHSHSCETKVAGLSADEALASLPTFADELEMIFKNFIEDHYKVLGISYTETPFASYVLDEHMISVFQAIANAAPYEIKVRLQLALHQMKNKPIGLVVNSFHNSVKQLAKRLKKDINFTISGEDVRVDFDRLSPILRTLVHALNNACDHGIEDMATRSIRSKPRKGQLSLTFRQTDDGGVIITVADDGNGIDRSRLSRLAFERKIITKEEYEHMSYEDIDQLIFASGLSSAQIVTQTSGRGVGMAALKEACENLGGKIHVDSVPLQGTTITMTIPSFTPTSRVRSSVLIVEDEADIRNLFRDVLEDMGVEVMDCDNGLDALLALSKKSFDLVVTDLRMPGMEGEALVKKIRDVRKDNVPILVVSGYLNPQTIARLQDISALEILPKGATITEFRNIINKLVRYSYKLPDAA